MLSAEELSTRIRQVLKEHGRLDLNVDSLSDTDDLYDAGMTSHANVNVMLALESEFEIEFPDAMLKRGTFDSLGSIRKAVESLVASSI
jgi:acyl carrier protein